MALAGAAFRSFFGRQRSDEAIHLYGQAARNVGVTTLTDLGTSNLLDEAIVRQWLGIVDHGYPMRVAMFHGAMENGAVSDENCAAALVDLKQQSTDHLRLGQVKLLLDGSIQGGTARLRWPGFQHGGVPAREDLDAAVLRFLRPRRRALGSAAASCE